MDNSLTYALIVVAFLSWFWWRWKRTSFFQELGIPGPKPSFLFGNLVELFRKGPLQCHDEWLKNYGSVLGYYYGMRPVLLVADPQLIRTICIRDFHLFPDRPEIVPLRIRGILDYILPTRDIFDSMVVNVKGERWKHIRSTLTPTFSTAKMKLMSPTVNTAVDELISKLDAAAENEEVIDIYDYMQGLTLDVICRTAFGVQIDAQRNPDNPFLKSAKLTIGLNYTSPLLFFGHCFPELATIPMIMFYGSALIANKGSIPPLQITKMLQGAIKYRRENPQTGVPDLLQLMIEASETEQDFDLYGDTPMAEKNSLEQPQVSSASNPSRQGKFLTDLEIQANALVVLLAGYDSTSTTLAFAFYFLAKYPDHQEKVRDEINELLKKEEELKYYSVNQLPLLDRFLSETMRYYPTIIHILTRIATADVEYQGLRVPKGLHIHVPVFYMHHNTEHWTDPETFDPDRFLPENKTSNFSATYVPFGTGPRNCIGMRFALMVVKMTLAKLLPLFEFASLDQDGEVRITLKQKVISMAPEKVLVKPKRRIKQCV